MATKNKNRNSKGNFYRDYRVKVYGNGYNQLVGLPFLNNLLDRVLLEKILLKAGECLLDKFTVKLRRGIQITFYYR